jgi:murein DD-endopeptidase MepM/ murein hydrolase activator NlpD
VDHGDVSTLYFHLDAIRADLATGTRVVAGETLATLGRTGVQTSPTHLHFAVLVDGAYVDPLRLLRRARVLAAGRGARATIASAAE